MPSASLLSTRLFVIIVWVILANGTWAQELPDGAGKAETERVCTTCHNIARAVSLHQDRGGWQNTIDKMVSFGAKASDAELQAIINYLATHYPAEDIPKININRARAIDLESGLTLRRSEAAIIIEYRTKNGPFRSIEDLEKVPGIDVGKIESKKDRLIFQDTP
jgi:competence protein ComEA